MSDGGKGSAPRPLGVDWKKFEENWDAVFGKVGGGSKPDSPADVDSVDGGDKARDCGGAQHGSENKPTK